MRHFSGEPPANRVAQIEHNKAQGQLVGSAIIVVLALACLLVGLTIVMASLPPL